MKKLIFGTCLMFAGLLLGSCNNQSKSGDSSHHHKNMHMAGAEYNSTYVCPMHCEGSGADEAGTCPVCGMDYVLNEEHMADGHHHDEDGHQHEDDSDHNHNHNGSDGHDHN